MSRTHRLATVLLLASFTLSAPGFAANTAANSAANCAANSAPDSEANNSAKSAVKASLKNTAKSPIKNSGKSSGKSSSKDSAKNSASQSAISSAKTSPDKPAVQEPDVNTAYTPLLLPEDAAQSGISLSGETKMYKVSDAHYHVGCGCAMVHTEEAVLLDTCRAQVFARAGATLVVSAKPDATRVLNLSDRKHDSVRVVFGNTHISLNPGEELVVVSATATDVEKAAAEYIIRYRNAQTISVSPEYKAMLFEFSLADAMKHCLIFKQLSQSPKQEDKVLLAEIIKTAAAVNTMFGKSREKYTHGPDDPEAQPQKGSGIRIAFKKKQNKRTRIASTPSQSTDD